MAVIHGSTGLATLASPYDTGLNIYEWSGSITNDEYPADVFVDDDGTGTLGHTFAYGMYQFRGQIRAYLDDTTNLDATQIVPGRAVAVIALVAHQGAAAGNDQKYTFSGHLNNFRITVNKQTGLNSVDADVVSTTAIVPQNFT